MHCTIKPVDEKDKDVLSRLLYAYQRELLPYSGESLDEIKTYKYLPDYFADPTRAAFFIVVDGKIGGFVLVNTHTLIEKQAHSIAEFYIVPAFRRKGVGEHAATLVFAKFPGNWEVAQMAANLAAIHFWRKVINKVTKGQYKETLLNTNVWQGSVQSFAIS